MNLDQVVAELENKILNTASKRERAKLVYDWIQKNISYDDIRRDNLLQGFDLSPQTPEETLLRMKGVCADQAILYAAIGKRLRLKVNYASVDLGEYLNHAINIVESETGPIQVDTTNGIFGASYQNYKIKPLSILQNNPSRKSIQPFLLTHKNYHQPGCATSALIAAGIGAVVALGLYFIPPILRSNNVKYLETNDSVRFITKNGDLKFTLDEDAKKLVKEAFFYTEATKGDSKDRDLLAPYVTADVNGDNHFTKEEAKDARDRARADYLRSLR